MVRAQQENIDDVKLVRTIVNRISKEHKMDRSRVFCTSISNSNGAFMSHHPARQSLNDFDANGGASLGLDRCWDGESRPGFMNLVQILVWTVSLFLVFLPHSPPRIGDEAYCESSHKPEIHVGGCTKSH